MYCACSSHLSYVNVLAESRGNDLEESECYMRSHGYHLQRLNLLVTVVAHAKQAVERVLRELRERFNTAGAVPRVVVVRLTGLAHSEDRVAFREAARQLCTAFGADFVRSASYDDNLAFLRQTLQQLAR